jgi:hypothetical protein
VDGESRTGCPGEEVISLQIFVVICVIPKQQLVNELYLG